MDPSHQIPLLLILIFFVSNLAALSASASISDAVVGQQVVNGRRILQVKKACPIDIENQNYTVITSQCKGPDYPPEPCCSSLTELACPIRDELNDLSNDCAQRFFSYLTRTGQYPDGLFSSICRGNKNGLPCPVPPPSSSPNAATRALLGCHMFAVLLLFPLQFVVCFPLQFVV